MRARPLIHSQAGVIHILMQTAVEPLQEKGKSWYPNPLNRTVSRFSGANTTECTRDDIAEHERGSTQDPEPDGAGSGRRGARSRSASRCWMTRTKLPRDPVSLAAAGQPLGCGGCPASRCLDIAL